MPSSSLPKVVYRIRQWGEPELQPLDVIGGGAQRLVTRERGYTRPSHVRRKDVFDTPEAAWAAEIAAREKAVQAALDHVDYERRRLAKAQRAAEEYAAALTAKCISPR